MQDLIKVTGMVIKSFPQGEYDRRIVLLTKEMGRITAFVKGARKQGSRFQACSDLFVFGDFVLFPSKTAYTVQDVSISNYFEYFRNDINAAYYGMYFMEMCDYYATENSEESLLLLLLYKSLQGLKSQLLSNSLVRTIFELKLFIIEGELIPPKRFNNYSEDTLKALDYLFNCYIDKLFVYPLTSKVIDELTELSGFERNKLIDKKLNSLDMLEMIDII